MKVFRVAATIRFVEGSQVTLPMGLYDNEQAAQRFVSQINSEVSTLGERGLVALPTSEDGAQVAMPLIQFLGNIGIQKVGFRIIPQEVHGSVVVAPASPPIILAH